MFIELITRFGPALVAAFVLIPTAAFLVAMLMEGARRNRWGEIRRATRTAFVSQPLDFPVRRASTSGGIGGGGFGMRRVTAAPQEHE